MIATWLVPYGKKKKSPCGLLPRLFHSVQGWGLERQEPPAFRHAPLGREREVAGALGLWGNRFPSGGRETPVRRVPSPPSFRKAGSLSLSHTHTHQ